MIKRLFRFLRLLFSKDKSKTLTASEAREEVMECRRQVLGLRKRLLSHIEIEKGVHFFPVSRIDGQNTLMNTPNMPGGDKNC